MDQAYNRVILEMDMEHPGYIQAILQWLVYCRDEPTIEQLAEVVLVDHGRELPTFEESRRISTLRLTELCYGLISVKTVEVDGYYADTTTATRVCFLPLSLKLYLLSERTRSGPMSRYSIDALKAEEFIANTCLAYLRNITSTTIDADRIRQDFPLADYAATFWNDHIASIPATTTWKLAVKLFRDGETGYKNWLRILSHPPPPGPFLRHPQQRAVSTLSAQFGSEHGCFVPPLVWVSALGLTEFVRRLLAAGVNVNDSGVASLSALAIAAYMKHTEIVQMLLNAGGDVSNNFEEGGCLKYEILRAPLYQASRSGDSKMVEMLLRDKRKHGKPGWKLEVALECASDRGHVKIVQQLIEAGVDVDAQGRRFGCALQAAAFYPPGRTDVVRLLLGAGANPNTRCEELDCPLQTASYWTNPEIVRMLLVAGANVALRGAAFGTSLIASSWRGSTLIVEQLLEAGSDVYIEWDLRYSLYELNFEVIDAEEDHVALEKRLEQELHEEELPNETTDTEKAEQRGKGYEWELREEMLSRQESLEQFVLMKYKSSVGATWRRGKMVEGHSNVLRDIKHAASGIFRRLQKAGVQENSKGQYLFTAIQAAIASEYNEVVQLLLKNGVTLPTPVRQSPDEEKRATEKIARILRLKGSLPYKVRTSKGELRCSGTVEYLNVA